MNLLFRQLFDPRSSTYTYLLADSETKEAVLIDPVFDQARRDAALLDELDLALLYTLDTHVHADHVTAAWLLKQKTGSRIAISESSGAAGMDIPLRDGDRIVFGAHTLEARATPGHTNGCMTFVLDDRRGAFTGDALLIRGSGRTDFQGGDPHALYRSIVSRIFTLPDTCLIYPAHDYRGLTASSVAEEKRHNPRIGGQRDEADFVGFMSNLNLPHPKQMDAAVPANLKCGEVEAGAPELSQPDWAPLRYTYAGINEIDVDWVAEHIDAVEIIDVREPDELAGPLGHIPGVRSIPLGQLAAVAQTLRRDRPIVTVCRSGGRSAQAAVLLEKAGFDKVANLSGGMLSWNEHRLPVERSSA
jgi:sulfur dioxygenase